MPKKKEIKRAAEVTKPVTPVTEKATHDRSTIREIREFVDAAGRKVVMFTQTYGKSKDPDLFKGITHMKMPGPRPGIPGREISLEFPFLEDVTTARKAFEVYDKTAKEFEARMIKQVEDQQRIAQSKGGSGLVGLNGQPLGGGKV